MGNCELIFIVEAVITIISIASTSYLFLLRVRAVYLKSRYITAFFGVLWIIAIAGNILATSTTRFRELHSDFI